MEFLQTIVAVFIVIAAFIYILKTVFLKKEEKGCSDCCQCTSSHCQGCNSHILNIDDQINKK